MHDIGRFEQHKIYGTYIDFKSIDHGDFGTSVLEKDNYINQYIKNKENAGIILKAVKNHNKFAIEEGLDEKTNLFCKIVRDADKIDIMEQQGNKIIDTGVFCNDETIESIFKCKQSKNTTVLNDADIVLRILCFVFDFNFNYTFKYVLERNIIPEKIKFLEGHVSEKYDLNEIEDVLINYIKKRI